MKQLNKVCLQALNRQQWIITEHKTTIIRNIDQILAFHSQLVTCLDSVQYDWSLVAKTFLEQVNNFSLYKQYCGMHTEAWSLLSFYRNRSEWAQFIKECTSQDDDSLLQHQQKRLHFEDYLIKPVQRICRYQLLVKEIMKYTSPDKPEYDLWTAVLSEMQEIVTEIDNLTFQKDMKERTDRFIERLDGDCRISKGHVSQLGNLLVAGAIEVTYSALGSSVSKPRYLGCFVFPTYIILVRPKKVTNYEPKHWFPLKMADFENLEDIEDQREHSFIVRCKKHTFIFSATCAQEKQLWTKKIQEAIGKAKTDYSEDTIIPSLPGVATNKNLPPIRPSRSFSNILDMTLTSTLSSIDKSRLSDRQLLRRSISSHVMLENNEKKNKRAESSLVKRYSADYATNQQKKRLDLKPRNNSETYIKPEPSNVPRRRHSSSLDFLSDTNSMISKMSIQFKNNHQHAMRLSVDHKLRDVCTQEYLSSRARHMRDTEPLLSVDMLIKKKKSSSLLRNSVSNLSLMMPRRMIGESVTKTAVPEAELMDEGSSSLLPKSSQIASSVQSTPRQSSFDCTFTILPSSMTESNYSTIPKHKNKKKGDALAQRVLRQIASIRHIKPSIPDWNMSADTLRCETSDAPKKYSLHFKKSFASLRHSNNNSQLEEPTRPTAFAYATTPSARKNPSWKSRLPKFFFIHKS
ncbi:hypothetical protein G6F37_002638 [Rhizopus arrhizus]|nr:hypothetical protein G6F37_002638 [Rhizopus arrhizus]